MGHELSPRTGDLLPAGEVVRRLREEFRVVEADAAEGTRRALAVAAWIERMPAHAFFGRQQENLAQAGRLRALSPGDALVVEFGDVPERLLNILVLPEQPIKFGYESDEHEAECWPLVERCARVLECDVVLF